MNPRARVATISCIASVALLLIGFCVGAFETFGGYVSRQRAFFWISIAAGLVVALFLARKWKASHVLAGTVFLFTQIMYILGRALGMTFYVGFSDRNDFFHTLWMALNNQL